jgi:hypothetical protein
LIVTNSKTANESISVEGIVTTIVRHGIAAECRVVDALKPPPIVIIK